MSLLLTSGVKAARRVRLVAAEDAGAKRVYATATVRTPICFWCCSSAGREIGCGAGRVEIQKGCLNG
jgi:hypothetical protein